MPDIFLSYSRQDLAVARPMAAALMAAGHSVWWDQALKAGEVYDRVTETALREARLVVVLWSKASVQSDWVRSEATVALQRGALVPVMIEDCQRPVMFELRQSADLIGWKGNRQDLRLAALLADVARQLGAPAVAPAPPAAATPNRRLLIGGAAGLAALSAGGFGAWKLVGSKPDDGSTSIAVLPFANLSGDPGQAFFSDGIAEELRNALLQIRGLKVIGRVSSEQFRDARDVSAAAERLGVEHVLTGSVRRSPATIRISAQLVDVKTGVESWSQSYDQPVGDALAIQSKIATSVVAALSAKLGAAAGTIFVGGTRNAQAQEAFLKAEQLSRTGDSKALLQQQLVLLDAALALDPDYAEAWAMKGNVSSNLRAYAKVADETAALEDAAMAASGRAVRLAPNSGFAHMSLANRYRNRLDMRRAVAEAEEALRLALADPRVLADAGALLRQVDPDRGVFITQDALALDPLNPLYVTNYCFALIAARRYQEALEAAQRAMAMSNNQIGSNGLVAALFGLGRFEEARANLQKVPVDSIRYYQTVAIEARIGNRAASDAALQELSKIEDGSINTRAAALYAQRGDKQRALDALEAAYRAREPQIALIRIVPFLDPIRGEPRFKAVQDAVIPPDLWVPPKRA